VSLRQKIRKRNRYLIWIPCIGVIIYMAVTAGGFKEVDFLYQTTYGLSISDIYALFIYLIAVILVIIMSFAIGRRAFCHYACWISPFMIAGRKLRNLFRWPSLRLVSEKDKCIDCMTCTKNCPMSLDVNRTVKSENMENPECILCGTCVDNCKQRTIRFTFTRGK
jgi:ferredoxin-type protein NapH